FDEIVVLHRTLISEDAVMHLPKLSLFSCSHGCLVSQWRVMMEIERKVLVNQFDAIGILLQQGLQRRHHAGTERTLEVRKLHHRNRRLPRTPEWGVADAHVLRG